ncbi:sodium-dependent glucose transporter 1B-like [Brevipalpus obovatus]|uniref:sodium-dependent glucose transporter 1B-like n=1 Tax=Brevipalpus obovatus TaxID=246614 RepID=UPI003D9E3263
MGFHQYVKDHRSQLIVTCLTLTGYFAFAARCLSIGVALLDLQIQVQETFSMTSQLVTTYSIFYLLGGCTMAIFGQICHNHLIQAVTTIGGGIALAFIPIFYNIWIKFPLVGINGYFNAFFETASNVLLIDLWGTKVGNYMQIMHFAFGLGGLLTPVMIRPFQLPIPEELADNPDECINFYKPDDVQIIYPYLGISSLSVIIGIGFAFCYYNAVSVKAGDNNQAREAQNETSQQATVENPENPANPGKPENPENSAKSSKLKIAIAVAWVAMLGHVGFSMQQVLCVFGQAYGVKSGLRMEKRNAALIATVYWIAVCLSKILFIICSSLIDQKFLIAISCSILFLAQILSFTLASSYEICLWLVAFLTGIGFGPLFVIAFTNLEKYFHITGRHSSLIFIVIGIGESFHVPIVGTIIDHWHDIYLYYSGILSVIFLASFIAMQPLCKFLFGDEMIEKSLGVRRLSRLGSIMIPIPDRRGSIISSKSEKLDKPRSSSVFSIESKS